MNGQTMQQAGQDRAGYASCLFEILARVTFVLLVIAGYRYPEYRIH